MIKIAILASGSGTNAEALINHFKGNKDISIELVLSNKENAGVLKRAKRLGVEEYSSFTRAQLESDALLNVLKAMNINLIILAGFLLKIPPILIEAFPKRIINIHPALLPKYGGKGMYGAHVHESVIANNDAFSGITIHLVNEVYDEGEILFQDKVAITPSDTPDSLATKIHALEHEHYPVVVEKYAKQLLRM